MYSLKELQEQLFSATEPSIIGGDPFQGNEVGIVVFRSYRHYKKLSIELFKAPTTLSGKIKNPLTPINPLDYSWKSRQLESLQFYSAVSRFQNNPTTAKSAADLDALRVIMKNPLGFRFFYHNPDFSENVVAGSLHEVAPGTIIKHIAVCVNRNVDHFQILPYVTIKQNTLPFTELEFKYDYFILHRGTIHLLGNFNFLKFVRFFSQHTTGLKIHESRFEEFRAQVLYKLENFIAVDYTYLQPAAKKVRKGGSPASLPEKILYLSDLDPYVAINPVMIYGDTEIPVLTRRQIFSVNEQGETGILKRDDEAEIRFIALLLKQCPEFEEQLEGDLMYFYMHKKAFLEEEWFLNAFEQWQRDGITVLGFNQLKGNKYNGNKASITIQVTSGLNWFNTKLDVRFGKKQAALKQLQKAVRNRSRFVQLDDGTLGILPLEWLDRLSQFFDAAEVSGETLLTPKINFLTVKQLYQEQELNEAVKEEISRYETRVESLEALQDVEVPRELQTSLRNYQKQGLKWLNFLDDHNFGGCLADDMGLGKTVQIIAFILLQRTKAQQNTNLIVVPTSLIFNWQAEIQKFAPSIKMLTLYGSNRIKLVKELEQYEVVLTSYGTLLSDAVFLKNFTFNYIFLDESQNIKNIASQRYAAVQLLKSRNKITITGTPIENNTFDLYAQLSFACPGLLGNKQYFKDLFSMPIDKFKSSKRAKELQQKIAPFVLRRTKKDVADELPEKTEVVLYCPMEEEQQKIYDRNEQELRDAIEGLAEDELKKSSMHVLKGLTRLRQICNSPMLLEDEKAFDAHSSKIKLLMKQVENNAPGHKILIFSQFVSMLHLIEKELEVRGIAYECLTGSTKDREQVVGNFQKNEQVRVFLISLKAGGTGLNLTEADYVYLVDPWWNPAVENQAIDRSYRIGQKKKVIAVRMICPGTIEEKIVKLQETKRSLSEDLIKTDNPLISNFSKEEWLSLLS